MPVCGRSRPSPNTVFATSDLYRELLPAINSRMVMLLDQPRSVSQLCSLERHVGRSGRDAIDHPTAEMIWRIALPGQCRQLT
jgi:hypothetical protein